MDHSDYIAGGYRVSKFVEGASHNAWMRSVLHATEDLLPDKLLSIGMCTVPRAPLLEWQGALADEYEQFGIPDHLPELNQWATEHFEKDFGYPDIFYRLTAAVEYVQRFTTVADIQILGIGVHRQDLSIIAEAERLRPATTSEHYAPVAGFADVGFAQAIHLAEPCAPGGEIVGFDVICCDYDIDHSWHCGGLAVTALERFNFRPNRYGLIDERENAVKLAGAIRDGSIRAEPGVWLPVLVSRYAPGR